MALGKLLTFISSGVMYGIPIDFVGEMIPLSKLEQIPGVNTSVRGGVVIRDEIIPVLDLRVLMNKRPLMEERKELVEVLNQREQDHIAWLDDLLNCVKTGAEFRKTLDPTKCAFGAWFYSYVPPDSTIERLFRQFEEPHNEIHGIGSKVVGLLKSGKRDDAIEVVERARLTTLERLRGLFRDFKHALLHDSREITIVLRNNEQRSTSLAVENVNLIVDLDKDQAEPQTISGQSSFVTTAYKLPCGVVYCLDPEKVFNVAMK